MYELEIPTMKSLDPKKGEVKAEKAEEKPAEKIDFSKVKVEPLFEEMVDSTLSASQIFVP